LAPVVAMIVGSMIAVAALLAKGWADAAHTEGFVVAGALGCYWLGRTDTDLGAMLAARADERQVGVRQRARGLAAVAMLAAALVGGVISPTLGTPAWPFALVAAVGVMSFLASLAVSRATLVGAGSDLSAMVVFKADERQTDMRQRAAQVACMATVVADLVGAIAFIGTKPAWDFDLVAAVGSISFLAVLVVNLAGRNSHGER
jgi:hypothetical protein